MPATAAPATPTKPTRRVSTFRLLVTTIICLFLAIMWALLIRGKLRAMEVSSGSMIPTLEVKDTLLVWYGPPSEIERGDIVVISSPDDEGADLVKRVVAIPGDTVAKSNGQVMVNGEPSNPPGTIAVTTLGPDYSYYLGEDEFFVLGDNRKASHDSQQYGPIRREQILGSPLYRYAPRTRMGSVK